MEFLMMFELYYFNIKRNFYEPLVESTNLKFQYEHSKATAKKINIKIPDILNVNFPVALFDTIVQTSNTLEEELDHYKKAKDDIDKNDTSKQEAAHNPQYDIAFNPSLYFIKNSTGETLMFKTSADVKYSELMPEESSELLFEVMKDNKNDAHDVEEEEKGDHESQHSRNQHD